MWRGVDNGKNTQTFMRRAGGGSKKTFLRCGDLGWGNRHIASKHFGSKGYLSSNDREVIRVTLRSKTSRSEVNSGGHRRMVYEENFVCANNAFSLGQMSKRYTFTARVVVNPQTNNIVSAYILDPSLDAAGLEDCY
jgi:hypothetical protein